MASTLHNTRIKAKEAALTGVLLARCVAFKRLVLAWEHGKLGAVRPEYSRRAADREARAGGKWENVTGKN